MKGPLRPGAWSQVDCAVGGLASCAGSGWDLDRHLLMVLMLRPVAVVGAVGGLVAGSSLSLVCQAALKPLTRETMLVRSACFPPAVGVLGGGGR